RLISCEHDTRRITRTEYDGSVPVRAESYPGHRLNSPNEIVVKSDGTIWFTDPPFGISGFYEGHKAPSELPQNVSCLEPE
ncbi:SMP-30/gluconolactonase/LRE family protein, partial [Klebsiella pneumoniae]|nr:SMP-30/gluconolactonase/LRE family protein [Klebsiella pneumoniae]